MDSGNIDSAKPQLNACSRELTNDNAAFDTAPPSIPAARQRWKHTLKKKISASILPLAKYIARPYVGGETLDDALCVSDRLALENLPSTLGFWDTADDSARQVAEIYLAVIDSLSAVRRDSYISIKPPALRFDPALALELAAAAQTPGIRLHCDSHGPEVADYSNAMIETMLNRIKAHSLGTTLPGRWSRSLRDADWAIERGLNIRVVKGQWPDPHDSLRDPATGFLEVIDRVVGRVPCIAVATHDVRLASEAITRIRASGTPYELELLFGSPYKPLLNWARQHGVKARIYVPFGGGFVPNAINVVRQNPRLAWTIAKDRLKAVIRLE